MRRALVVGLLVGTALLTSIASAAPDAGHRRRGAGKAGGGTPSLPFPRTQLPDDRRAVEAQPDDPATSVRLAADLVRAGQPAEAIPYFRFAEGTQALERAFSSYADALRDIGRGHEAAELRQDRWEVEPSLTSHLAVINDLQAAGDVLGALDAVAAAEGDFPMAAVVFDHEADLLLDAGDPAGADVALALARRLGATNARRVRVEARLLALAGDREAAVSMLEPRLMRRSAKEDDVHLLGSLLVEGGEAEDALALVERSRWSKMRTPTIQGIRVEALLASGRADEAIALCRTVRGTFGTHRHAVHAEAAVRAATGKGCTEP